ncbi:hypothetical protein SAMN05444172_4174 [Burkholderia sp. GAS332]|nr:hypothetical protein SAMN05444172_4174 [Burkholderia sp. GAS332]
MGHLTPLRRLISASCSSGQRFAFGFLQIRGRPRHPCRSANTSPCRACRGLSPLSECALPGAPNKKTPLESGVFCIHTSDASVRTVLSRNCVNIATRRRTGRPSRRWAVWIRKDWHWTCPCLLRNRSMRLERESRFSVKRVPNSQFGESSRNRPCFRLYVPFRLRSSSGRSNSSILMPFREQWYAMRCQRCSHCCSNVS